MNTTADSRAGDTTYEWAGSLHGLAAQVREKLLAEPAGGKGGGHLTSMHEGRS
jgi:hypothetical protein